ncbi:MAG TPA: bifunctional UDP-sugar hydrolase/5'-nucleotidase [Kiritimatiellia bacterium]|nr:bifunctional UDP-sugar hydrolase/5'-nucleotidase [Kiritimatiellia bacterium]HRZ10953.1 bifunctional UDP-sugar hydrolase/5'-nucleotidase [Kiritimatiellia bacterium]HSA18526.1 bifunctional UDP-sugar hydrolase/5'-nucleotidase [Kiritimatiellia bacterium]
MKGLKSIAAGLLALVLAASSVAAREIAVTILHTTDVHGFVEPTRDYEGNENVGGLLRCATLIRQARDEAPGALLVDCGDLWIGSPESLVTRTAVARKAVAWLKYDAWVIGNHDFDWGLGLFQKLLESAPAPALGANIRSRPGAPNPAAAVHPYLIREVEGIRVALVGLTTPGMPGWFLPEYLGSLEFEASVPALRRIMPSVREAGAEIRVLLVHQGVRPFGDDEANELERIAAAFPEFDVILGGHSHQVVPGIKIRDVWYSQAGYYATVLGRVDLVYDTVRQGVVRVDCRLLPAGADVEPSAELQAVVQAELDKAAAQRRKIVGRTVRDLVASVEPPGQSPAQQLLAHAIAAETGAEIVLHGILAEDTIPAGPITGGDLWRLVPYENRVGLLSLTAAELKAVLEENVQHLGTPQFQGVCGLAYDLDPAAPEGRRVLNLRLADGSKLHGRKRYRVAMNSYVLASGGRRYPVVRKLVGKSNTRFELTDLDTRMAVARYLRKHRPLDLGPGDEVRLLSRPRPAAAAKASGGAVAP